MSFKSITLATVAAIALAAPAFAESMIKVDDPYARVSAKTSKSGAAFMVIENHGDAADQLIDARSDVAKKVELHTHSENADGVMQMLHVPEGFTIPAHGNHMLMRGGDHVMFIGLNQQLEHGDVVTVTLVFEKAGEMTVEIPVDLERKPMHGGGHMNHGTMKKN
ncbi:copper chaperone PCu(A)C [Shimia thalassica]|uniref:copper chaperone PCu(A)C n=1 Tax=Shimia thalassica TaxID=1715693 RepID=UPI0026E29260|nr:copper chaperone PCu(A)C [Shimia thalassica]MDO6479935.1 copper chaperone PCu(A)C [Shimia thalassica]